MTLYPPVALLLQSFLASLHRASLHTITDLVWALLLAQSLHPSDLARALPTLRTRTARQALRRVRRILGRSVMASTSLTPRLIPTVLRLVQDAEVFLILDSTRCLRWEFFTLGVLFHGRVLPIAWTILPYPWPKKQFTPTVVSLVQRTLAAWPSDRPVHLLADRGFPSLKLFAMLARWQKSGPVHFTIRLRAGDWVRLDSGYSVKVLDLLDDVRPGVWRTWRASYQQQRRAGPSALLVIGRDEPSPPLHQRGPADRARREATAQRRVRHLLSKGQPHAPQTDRVWILLTTAASAPEATAAYALRFHTEGFYRDVKSWDLERVAAHETDSSHLEGVLGLLSLTYLLQTAIGAEAGRTDDSMVRARQRQWSTADRLSVFWRGRQVLHDRAYDWRPWMRALLPPLTEHLRPLDPGVPTLGALDAASALKEAA